MSKLSLCWFLRIHLRLTTINSLCPNISTTRSRYHPDSTGGEDRPVDIDVEQEKESKPRTHARPTAECTSQVGGGQLLTQRNTTTQASYSPSTMHLQFPSVLASPSITHPTTRDRWHNIITTHIKIDIIIWMYSHTNECNTHTWMFTTLYTHTHYTHIWQ